MRFWSAHLGLSILLAVLAGCSVGDSQPAAVESSAPPPDLASGLNLVIGDIEEFEDGTVTELVSPRSVYVASRDGMITVLWQKDPNNGCRLQMVDAELREYLVDSQIPDRAVFYDACHGHTYDHRGQSLDPTLNSMRVLPTVVTDGQVIVGPL